MSLAELAVAALVLVIVVGVLVGVTLFTFPAASVLRTLGRPDPSRHVQAALGRRAVVRDLGTEREAIATLDGQEIRVSWTATETRVEVSGTLDPLPTDVARTDARETLSRLGEVQDTKPIRWRAFRPPDPQLARVIRAARVAVGQ